jgi:hypothetical protein
LKTKFKKTQKSCNVETLKFTTYRTPQKKGETGKALRGGVVALFRASPAMLSKGLNEETESIRE